MSPWCIRSVWTEPGTVAASHLSSPTFRNCQSDESDIESCTANAETVKLILNKTSVKIRYIGWYFLGFRQSHLTAKCKKYKAIISPHTQHLYAITHNERGNKYNCYIDGINFPERKMIQKWK
jgi:hypothetical protein